MIFGFIVEKNADLLKGGNKRKFKGRVVLQANKVKKQNWKAAMLEEFGSSLASMDAGILIGAYGLMLNNSSHQPYAVQSYPFRHPYEDATLGSNCPRINGARHRNVYLFVSDWRL